MDRGIPLLLRAAENAVILNERESEMSAFINLGNAYRRKGDLDKALDYHLKAYEIDREIKDKDSEAAILVNIGNVYHDKKDFKNALHYHQTGLDKAIQKGNSIEEANALVLRASDYLATGKIIAALKSNWSALKLARKIRAKPIEGEALALFGYVFKAFGLGIITRTKYFRQSDELFNNRRTGN